VGIYTARAADTQLLYVLAPSPKGAADPLRSVEAIGGDPLAARITLANGAVYEVRFHLGQAAEWKRTQ
jgi:hypothetical protein